MHHPSMLAIPRSLPSALAPRHPALGTLDVAQQPHHHQPPAFAFPDLSLLDPNNSTDFTSYSFGPSPSTAGHSPTMRDDDSIGDAPLSATTVNSTHLVSPHDFGDASQLFHNPASQYVWDKPPDFAHDPSPTGLTNGELALPMHLNHQLVTQGGSGIFTNTAPIRSDSSTDVSRFHEGNISFPTSSSAGLSSACTCPFPHGPEQHFHHHPQPHLRSDDQPDHFPFQQAYRQPMLPSSSINDFASSQSLQIPSDSNFLSHENMQSPTKTRPIMPKVSSSGSSPAESSMYHDGAPKRLAAISKAPYQRPTYPKKMCPYCTDHPDGFRGEHELRRHVDRAHKAVRKMWVCVNASDNKNFFANCKHCRNGKKYGAYYNAAAHLRRQHFNPRPARGRARGGKPQERRGGKGGGDYPPMEELKKYMKEVDEVVDPSVSASLFDDGDAASAATPAGPRTPNSNFESSYNDSQRHHHEPRQLSAPAEPGFGNALESKLYTTFANPFPQSDFDASHQFHPSQGSNMHLHPHSAMFETTATDHHAFYQH